MIKLLIFIVVIAIPTQAFSKHLASKHGKLLQKTILPILAKTYLVMAGYMK